MTSDHFRFSAAAAMEAALLEAVEAVEAVEAAAAATVAILLLLRLLSALLMPLLLSAGLGLASVEATEADSFLFLAAKVVDDEDIDFSFLDGDFFFRLVSCS